MRSLNATTPQLKVVKNFLDAYRTPDRKNIEPLISKNFAYYSYPKVPNVIDGPRAQYTEKFKPVLSLLKRLDFTFHEVIEAQGKVILHYSATVYIVDGTQLDYDSLSIVTLVDEDGELKVADFKDFCDPEKRAKFFGLAAKILAEGTPIA